jgi:hypothetical protein
MIQYPRIVVIERKRRGVPDTPLEPVIGLAEGETRWRSMRVNNNRVQFSHVPDRSI